MHKIQDCVYVFKTRNAEHKKTCEVSAVFHDEFVHVQCCSIKCKKRNHKYFVSRAKLHTSGDIELKPGPVNKTKVRSHSKDPVN